MEIPALFLIALIVICPISMCRMMRRRHQGHEADGGDDSRGVPPEPGRDSPRLDEDMFRE